jgi:hypothetical protein
MLRHRIYSTLMVLSLILVTFTSLGTQSVFAYSAQLIDTFDGPGLDTNWWTDTSVNDGQVYVENGALVTKTSATYPYSSARVQTLPIYGDFDARVDYSIVEGWYTPTEGHLDGALLGVALGEPGYNDWSHITRLSEVGPGDFTAVYCSVHDDLTGHSLVLAEIDDRISGSYRIMRTGQVFDYYYRNPCEEEWLLLATHDMTVCHPDLGPVEIYLSNGSIDASQSFITHFDNFQLDYNPNTVNVDTVTPDRANHGDVLDITLSGSRFDNVDSVSFGDGINVTSFDVIDSNNINASIQIDTDALCGTRDIKLTALGEQYLFPSAFSINTDIASIEFVSARNFGIDGDIFNNELVNGFKFWSSHIGNTADGSGSTMYNLTSTLNSVYDFLWQEPGAQEHDKTLYNWSFGNVPENGTYGIAVGGDWDNTIFVDYNPGFTVSRTISPRILQQDGQQVFTLQVTAKEEMDHLRILISVNPNTLITPIIFETDATDLPESTDSYPGPNRWDVYLHHPQVDTLYTLQAVISVDIADGLGAVEYVPQVDIVCVNSTDIPQQKSSSVTCDPEQLDGLGSWTWSADGDYLWNWVYTFSKGITLNEYINAGPLVINAAANPNPVAVNTPVELLAQVSDSTTGSSNIQSVEYSLDNGNSWNDMEMTTTGVITNATALLGSFSQAGICEILVRATDSTGFIGPLESVLLAVYDPSAGFVTGGGWINSPPGALTSNPALTGKATFGFVSKYNKGANIPSGNTEFQFKAGDLNFKSTSYDWLVVAGNKAQFKGTGTINGMGEYKFMLYANDGSPDTFRIKITDGDNIVYDNKIDTDLGGGNIVIHK